MYNLPVVILLLISSLIGDYKETINEKSMATVAIESHQEINVKEDLTKLGVESSKRVVGKEVVKENNDKPIYENVPMEDEVLDYIYEKSVEMDFDYTTLLAIISVESDFGRVKVNKNKNGSTDSGIFQVNSSNISWLKKLAGLNNPDLQNYKDNTDMALALMDYEREYFKDKGYSKEKLEWITTFAYHRGRGNAIKMSKNKNWEHSYVTKVYKHRDRIVGG